MFTTLYLRTTDPALRFSQLFQPAVLFPMIASVLFHTIVYAVFLNLASYVFFNKSLTLPTNQRIVTALLIIMFLGFFARFFHVKDVYEAYRQDSTKTRNHLDRLYISWIFIS
jgi:hypothetical protein